MPKLKTKRGAAKRFRAKGNGGFKAGHSHMRHILTKKSPKRKRQLGRTLQISDSDVDELHRQNMKSFADEARTSCDDASTTP